MLPVTHGIELTKSFVVYYTILLILVTVLPSITGMTGPFYTFGANSHFYTVEIPECIALQDPTSGWEFEGLSFRIVKPELGTCPVATVPVHRLYNNRFMFNDSNHRFTTSLAASDALVAQGWRYEGVAFCAAN